MTRPRTSLEPPKYSPTMAPIRASVEPTLSAVKKYGSAFGTRTRHRMDQSDAAYERMSSSAAGSTEVSPRVTFTTTGKNTRTATIIILDSGLRTPNQLFMSGANAMIGTALAPIAIGSRSSRAVTNRAVNPATTTPATVPIARPPSASKSVAAAALPIGHRPAPHEAESAPAISEGAGNGSPRRSMFWTTSSQSAMVPPNTSTAGRYQRTRRSQRVVAIDPACLVGPAGPAGPAAPVGPAAPAGPPGRAAAALTRSRPLPKSGRRT